MQISKDMEERLVSGVVVQIIYDVIDYLSLRADLSTTISCTVTIGLEIKFHCLVHENLALCGLISRPLPLCFGYFNHRKQVFYIYPAETLFS